jgi:uncharacterized membrane-anchored protein
VPPASDAAARPLHRTRAAPGPQRRVPRPPAGPAAKPPAHQLRRHAPRGRSPGAALQHLILLGRQLGQPIDAEGSHRLIDFGSFQLKWELHNEFSSYTFFRPVAPGEGIAEPTTALAVVPADWLAGMPGKLIVATHVELRQVAEISPKRDGQARPHRPDGRRHRRRRRRLGVHRLLFEDGFSRFLVIDVSLTQRQAGRTVQRLVEIETYRLMALLAFPVAKEVGRLLGAPSSAWPT